LPDHSDAAGQDLRRDLQTHLAECDAAQQRLGASGTTSGAQNPQNSTSMLHAQLEANRLLIQQQRRELQKIKAETEAALRGRAEFLTHMGHEIRTPMNAIIGLSHLALKRATDARQRDFLQHIHQSGQHLLAVLNDMLDYSKVEAGQLAMEIIPFELDTVFETLTNLCAAQPGGRPAAPGPGTHPLHPQRPALYESR
jgi:signal transduction histidine kinase